MFKPIILVAKQTYRSHIKTRGFWLMVLSPLLMAAVFIGIAYAVMSMQSNTTPKLAVVDSPAISRILKADKQTLKVNISDIKNEDDAKKALKSQKIDGALLITHSGYQLLTQPKSEQIDTQVLSAILKNQQVQLKARNLGLNAAQTADLLRPIEIKTQVYQPGKTSGNNEGANYGLSVGIGIVTMTLVMMYVSMMAQEIANEKSSRIMEILLAATSPAAQYFGKILGIFALVLTQVVIYVVSGTAAIQVLSDNDIVKMLQKTLDGVTVPFVSYAVVFILSAVLLYLILTAIIAALINDQSQVQQAIQPMTYLAMFGYLVSFFLTAMPNNLFIQISSFVPFVAQSTMPTRLALSQVDWLGAMMSLLLTFVAIIVLGYFGLRVYARNVLSYSDENILKQLVNNLKK